MQIRALVAASTVLALAFAAGPASAQPTSTTAFVVEQFEPQPTAGLSILNVGTSDVLPHLQVSFGLFAHYVDDPLVVQRVGGDEAVVSRLIDDQLKLEFSAALGLFDMLSVGLVFPLTVLQSGDSLDVVDRPGESLSGVATNDLRVIVKAALMSPQDFDGFGLHLAIPVYFPTGDAEQFASDEEIRLRPTLGIDYRDPGSAFGVALNVGYTLRPVRRAHNHVSDDVIHWSVGLEVPTPAEALSIVGSVFGGIQTATNRDPFALAEDLASDDTERADNPIEVLGGVRVRLGDALTLMAGAGAGIDGSVGSPLWRGFFSFGYAPISRDADNDGIADEFDTCKTAAEDVDGFQDEDGCPELDNDVDGIPDAIDGPADGSGLGMCRDQPEDIDGFEDGDGCPDTDNDGDGVDDNNDKCPADKEDNDGFQDDDGCPEPDNDGDGIEDAKDGELDDATGIGRCAGVAEDLDGFEDDDGCPEPDNDGDGIDDAVDACPDDPETKNGQDDEDGCPDTVSKRVRVTATKIEILEKVFFRRGSAKIQGKSYPLLDEVARVLKEAKHITSLRVEGHTDSRGRDAKNMTLSDDRARAVMAYLTGQGVAAERMISQGFGETAPVGDNSTPDGRAANRRVEFNILEIRGKKVVAPARP